MNALLVTTFSLNNFICKLAVELHNAGESLGESQAELSTKQNS
jgi:hypothetical protein